MFVKRWKEYRTVLLLSHNLNKEDNKLKVKLFQMKKNIFKKVNTKYKSRVINKVSIISSEIKGMYFYDT